MIQLISLSALRQNYPPAVGTIGTETGKTGLGNHRRLCGKGGHQIDSEGWITCVERGREEGLEEPEVKKCMEHEGDR